MLSSICGLQVWELCVATLFLYLPLELQPWQGYTRCRPRGFEKFSVFSGLLWNPPSFGLLDCLATVVCGWQAYGKDCMFKKG